VGEPKDHDFGDVDEIDAEAIGAPGQRTFRLMAERGGRTASLWLEKEQLQAIALIIDQQVARFAHRLSGEHPLVTLASRFPSKANIDFKVGRMAVGYDEGPRRFVFTAHDVEDAEGEEPAFSCRATQPQVQSLSAKITEVVAAGRPRCPLCGAPIEGKHVCPASNGHVH